MLAGRACRDLATTNTRRNGSTTRPSRSGYAARSRRLNSSSKPGPQVVGQRLEGRARAGAGDPGEDGVGAGQHVEVRRLPGVDAAAEGREGLEVDRRVVAARDGDATRVVGVRRLGGQLGADGVAGLVEVARHLEGEPAARPHPRRPARAAGRGGRGPTGGWRWRPGRRPGRRRVTSRGGRRRRSRSTSRQPRPSRSSPGLESSPRMAASGQRARSSVVRLPGPQPRSTTVAGVGRRDPRDQLDEGTATLVGVRQVALGVPGVGHGLLLKVS